MCVKPRKVSLLLALYYKYTVSFKFLIPHIEKFKPLNRDEKRRQVLR